MKRTSFLLAFALAALFVFSNAGTQAVNNSLAERFASFDDKKNKQNIDYSGTYNFDKAHSAIGFRVKHLGLVDVPGYFRDFTGTINYDAKDVEKSSVEFTAKVTSVDTGVAGRDKHLRTADFFEVEKYPELTFKSTKVEKKGKNILVTGDFTLKGVTKQITFPVQIAGFLPPDERNNGRMGATAETSINRRDYGVNYGSTLANGVASLSDNVQINLQIEATRPKPQP
ncbi:MAG: YceI family protein [Acidobacteriota bacterium]|nr:YceI family protein [Acidobacteriota bacterium]